jgi:hypothetical protein
VGQDIEQSIPSLEQLLEPEAFARGQRALLLIQLVHRFGTLPESVTRRVDGANTEELVRWGKRILNAPSLDDVFASPQPPPSLEELLRPEVFKQGYEKGHEKGVQRGMSAFLLKLLVLRFGALPDAVTQRVTGASIEELKSWFDRMLDAASLDDVFAAPNPE